LLLAAGLVVLTVGAYGRLWENGFLDLDDELYITDNPKVLDGLTLGGIEWSWTTFHGGFWVPLTWMSLQADATLSSAIQGPRRKPLPLALLFHGQNLFWHAATVVLLFVVLRHMTGAVWRSALVAALFAVHPLHVESVAWATERKDVLSAFFWVLTLLAYGHYVQRPSVGRWLLVAAAFTLGLLAKPMLVTLPCVLLLLDWWPLGRWQASERAWVGLLGEKMPLFAITAAACVLAVVAQQHDHSLISTQSLPLSSRLANAVMSYGWYLEKTFWPSGLAIWYRHPLNHWQWGPMLVSGAVLIGITVLALGSARPWPWLLVGWLWFVGTLVPVIGLVQVGEQARADRFVYVPHIGLFIALVWSVAALAHRLRLPVPLQAVLVTASLLLLAGATWNQVGYWRNPETMWTHTLAVTTDNHRAHGDLGRFLLHQATEKQDVRLLGPARKHLEQAVTLQPDEPKYHSYLGMVLFFQGHLDKAAEQAEQVIQLVPQDDKARELLQTIRRQQKNSTD
jgi:tetratricopeptide (TPR) repeat protein